MQRKDITGPTIFMKRDRKWHRISMTRDEIDCPPYDKPVIFAEPNIVCPICNKPYRFALVSQRYGCIACSDSQCPTKVTQIWYIEPGKEPLTIFYDKKTRSVKPETATRNAQRLFQGVGPKKRGAKK